MGVLSSVYSVNVIFESPICRREYRNSQPPTPDESLSVIYLYTICSHGTEQNDSLRKPGHWAADFSIFCFLTATPIAGIASFEFLKFT
jgi:hypothetical protein